MKHTALIALCSFGILSMMHAQEFRFGFQASPTFSWMQTDVNTINPNGTNLGLKLGAIGEFYFGENYAITGGLGFAFNLGGTLQYEKIGRYWSLALENEELDLLNGGVDLKYNLQYVEVPIGLKMRTREFGYIRYFAEIPIVTLGFRSQSRGSITGHGNTNAPNKIEKLNIEEEIKAIALSWGLGGGIEYSVSTSTSLVGGIYYQRLFTDVNSDSSTYYPKAEEKDVPSGPEEAENSNASIGAITLRLGVIF